MCHQKKGRKKPILSPRDWELCCVWRISLLRPGVPSRFPLFLRKRTQNASSCAYECCEHAPEANTALLRIPTMCFFFRFFAIDHRTENAMVAIGEKGSGVPKQWNSRRYRTVFGKNLCRIRSNRKWIVRVRRDVRDSRVDSINALSIVDSAFQNHIANAIGELKERSEKKVGLQQRVLCVDTIPVFPVLCSSMRRKYPSVEGSRCVMSEAM